MRVILATLMIGMGMASAVPAAPAQAASAVVDLSATMTDAGDVTSVEMTPDGTTVVYAADIDGGADAKLYAVQVASGTTVRLDAITQPNRTIADFRISPDGQWVVYRADQDADNRFELFAVPISGGAAPIRISALLLNVAGDVRPDYAVTPDSSRVLYRVDRVFDESFEVLSVSLQNGGFSESLSGPLAGAQTTHEGFAVTANGQHAVFLANIDDSSTTELYSAPVLGGTLRKLNPDVAIGSAGFVRDFAVSADSARAVFVMDADSTNVFKLYSTPLGVAAPPAQLTRFAGAASTVSATDGFVISPDGTRVIFRTDPSVGQSELYVVPTADGNISALHEFTAAGLFNVEALDPAFSPDGSQLLFSIDTADVGVIRELFRVPVDATQPATKVNGPLAGGVAGDYAFAPDGARVLFRAAQTEAGQTDLLSALLTGETVRLNPSPVGTGGDVVEFAITPDGKNALMIQDTDDDGDHDGLFMTPVAGGSARRLTPDFAGSVDVSELMPTPSAGHLAYLADPIDPEHDRLYLTSLASPTGDPIHDPTGDPTPSFFVPLEPVRIYDSRPGELPPTGPKGLVGPNGSVDVKVTGVGSGVPDDATAVVLNVTATDALAPGYITVFGTGGATPLASALNLTSPNQTRPNAVVVPVGAGGMVTVYSQSGANIVVDVDGYFAPASGAVAAGRIEPVPPTRAFDTREGQPGPGPKGIVPSGGSIDVQITGVAGVPEGATAVVLNVTATESTAPGYVTVHGTGTQRPLASSLNVNFAGETAPNLVIAPIGAGGKITLYAQSATHLLADVTGYVTGPTAAVTQSGLFVVLPPTRAVDTRPGEMPATPPKGYVDGGTTVAAQIAGVAGVAAQVGLVLMNVTVDDAHTGFLTAFPHGQPRPLSSTINANGTDDTRANAALMPDGADGQIDFSSQSGSHLVVDVNGYTLP